MISILILVIAITLYFGIALDPSKLYSVAENSTFVFQVGCLFAWACTLIKLYKEIEHSEKLLPNKRIFILHGCLLTIYLLFFALQLILHYAFHHTDNTDTKQILAGIYDILIAIS